MDSEKAKKAAKLAEKELQEEQEEKQVQLIKRAIKQTLEEIKKKEKERNKLNKEIKVLKQDIDNIRAGRLDLIEERQSKNEEAKKTSIIEIIKEKEVHHYHHYDRWYEPYKIIFKYPDYYSPTITCENVVGNSDCATLTTSSSSWTMATGVTDIEGTSVCIYTVTNSIAKNAVAGTYQLNDGDCVTIN